MHRSPQSRLEWSVAQVGVGPGDRILEIGCGHGVAASLMCESLRTGHLTAIDRSAKMIGMAARRNAGFVASGRASFHVASFVRGAPGLDAGPFDRVVAIHVPVFLRGDPRRELDLVREVLAPGGRLCVPFQPLDPDSVPGVVAKISADLAAAGFEEIASVRERLASGPVGSVTATGR